MRKGRLICWTISLVICAVIIFFVKKEENAIPYEERTPINVYCAEEFQETIKNILEKSSLGDTHRVVLTDNKDEAEIVLTDRITTKDIGYERVGWTPLIVAFDDTTKNKVASYIEEGYLIESKSNNAYAINFKKIIDSTLSKEWKDNIYCPMPSTREGELFFDFLLVNINAGRYPRNDEEFESCTKTANEFLSSNIVIQCDAKERLEKKKIVENELYIIFEKDIGNMQSNDYQFEISYPTDTVLYEIYYCCKGNNEKKIRNVMNKIPWDDSKSNLKKILNGNNVRYKKKEEAYFGKRYYIMSDGFSYVDIPLKEE